jgi:plasmid stability protein
MKNVTVSLDDETYRRGRMRAAERDTSLSALVRQFLDSLGGAETEFERLKREEERLRGDIRAFSASDRIGRDALHERGGP